MAKLVAIDAIRMDDDTWNEDGRYYRSEGETAIGYLEWMRSDWLRPIFSHNPYGDSNVVKVYDADQVAGGRPRPLAEIWYHDGDEDLDDVEEECLRIMRHRGTSWNAFGGEF